MGAARNVNMLPKVKAGRFAVVGKPKGPSRTGGTDLAVTTAAGTAAMTGAAAGGASATVTAAAVCPAARSVGAVPPADGSTGTKLDAARAVGAATTVAMDDGPKAIAGTASKVAGARLTLTGMTAAAETAALAGTLVGRRVDTALLMAAGLAAAGIVPIGPWTWGAATTAIGKEAPACTGAGAGCTAAAFVDAEGAVLLSCSGVPALENKLLPGAEAAAGGALLLLNAKLDGSAERLD